MGEQAMVYEIRIKNHLDICWSIWFEGMTVTNVENGEAIISGVIADHAALHGILDRIRDLNITLVSVQQLPTPPASAAG
jgi:hypothetical protein